MWDDQGLCHRLKRQCLNLPLFCYALFAMQCTSTHTQPSNVATFSVGTLFCESRIRQCIDERLKEKCACPVCSLPLFIKHLKKNSSFGTIVACIRRIQKILAAPELPSSYESGPVVSTPAIMTPASNDATFDRQSKKKVSKKHGTSKLLPKKLRLKRLGLALTGLTKEDKQIIESSIHTIEPERWVSSVLSKYNSTSCSHVITNCNQSGLCQRTIKYLMAVLDGKWIVSIDCTCD